MINIRKQKNLLLIYVIIFAELLKALYPSVSVLPFIIFGSMLQTLFFICPAKNWPSWQLRNLSKVVIFCTVSIFYLVIEMGVGAFASNYTLYFLLMPILYLILSTQILSYGFQSIDRALFYFLVIEVIICLGQAFDGIFGINIARISENDYEAGSVYKFLYTGSFYNPNDLAAVIAAISFYYYKSNASKTILKFELLITSGLALIAASRVGLLVVGSINIVKLFIIPGFNLRPVVMVVLGSGILFFFSDFIDYNKSMDIIEARLLTIPQLLRDGLYSDNSISYRLDSYTNFIINVPHLGFGSMTLRNYNAYTQNLPVLFSTDPHSLIVEYGYWMGWIGIALIVILGSMLYVTRNRFSSMLAILVYLALSSISSSLIGNYMFIIVFMATTIRLNCIRHNSN